MLTLNIKLITPLITSVVKVITLPVAVEVDVTGKLAVRSCITGQWHLMGTS